MTQIKRTPILQEGMSYTLNLKNGHKIRNAIYRACVGSGQHYFTKGNDVFHLEDVQSHSLLGRNVPEEPDAQLVITDDAEVIEIYLSPNKTPIAYQRKLKELVETAGMTEAEAHDHLSIPFVLELFYDYGHGLFAVESEAVDATTIFSPYNGREVPKIEE